MKTKRSAAIVNTEPWGVTRKIYITFLTQRIRIRNYSHGSGSGSGSLHQQAKKLRKTLIFTVLRLVRDLLSLKTDENVPTLPLPVSDIHNYTVLTAIWNRTRITKRICNANSEQILFCCPLEIKLCHKLLALRSCFAILFTCASNPRPKTLKN